MSVQKRPRHAFPKVNARESTAVARSSPITLRSSSHVSLPWQIASTWTCAGPVPGMSLTGPHAAAPRAVAARRGAAHLQRVWHCVSLVGDCGLPPVLKARPDLEDLVAHRHERVRHHQLNLAPRALVVVRCREDQHLCARAHVRWQGGHLRPRVVLVDCTAHGTAHGSAGTGGGSRSRVRLCQRRAKGHGRRQPGVRAYRTQNRSCAVHPARVAGQQREAARAG